MRELGADNPFRQEITDEIAFDGVEHSDGGVLTFHYTVQDGPNLEENIARIREALSNTMLEQFRKSLRIPSL